MQGSEAASEERVNQDRGRISGGTWLRRPAPLRDQEVTSSSGRDATPAFTLHDMTERYGPAFALRTNSRFAAATVYR